MLMPRPIRTTRDGRPCVLTTFRVYSSTLDALWTHERFLHHQARTGCTSDRKATRLLNDMVAEWLRLYVLSQRPLRALSEQPALLMATRFLPRREFRDQRAVYIRPVSQRTAGVYGYFEEPVRAEVQGRIALIMSQHGQTVADAMLAETAATCAWRWCSGQEVTPLWIETAHLPVTPPDLECPREVANEMGRRIEVTA